jgi:hypothetical protein
MTSTTRVAAWRETVLAYYADARVRARIAEYSGGGAHHAPTAAYVAALDRGRTPFPSWSHVRRVPGHRIAELFTHASDLARSLWDAEQLLFVIELDHQNVDAPADPFLHPAAMFLAMEPTFQAALRVFHRFGCSMSVLTTGRGHHFVGQVALDHPVVREIAALVPETPGWYNDVDTRRPAGVTTSMSATQARAAAGLGCLAEYVAQLILGDATASPIPVVVNGTAVGRTGPHGRASVSIDFSHMGDPLDVRHVRTAFSTYQWHRLRPDIFGWEAASMVPPFAAVPRESDSLTTVLTRERRLDEAAIVAGRTRATLPDIGAGLRRMVASYRLTELQRVHTRFFDTARVERARQVRPLPAALPRCIAAPLQQPNDLLLKPEHVQHLVRGLMSRGEAPACVSRRMQVAYETDHSWGDRWSALMHPATRAEFETRVFAGLIETGHDRLLDFNCVSAQEKGLCPPGVCKHDLRHDRDRLLAAQS